MAKVTQRSDLGNGGSPQDGTGYQRKHIHVHSAYGSDTSAVPSSASPLDHSDSDESDSEYGYIDAKFDSMHRMLEMLLQAQEQKQKQVFNLNAIDGPVSPPLSVSAVNPADADAATYPSPTKMVTFYVPIRLAIQPCMPTEVEYHDLAADDDDDDDDEDIFPTSATEYVDHNMFVDASVNSDDGAQPSSMMSGSIHVDPNIFVDASVNSDDGALPSMMSSQEPFGASYPDPFDHFDKVEPNPSVPLDPANPNEPSTIEHDKLVNSPRKRGRRDRQRSRMARLH